MKLNYKRTILVGFAFFLISAFWQAYDNTIPLILTNKFGMSQTGSGIIMTLDNILALFMLPLFGSISDKCTSRMGRRKPFILVGTICAAIAIIGLSFVDNAQLKNIEAVSVVDDPAALTVIYDTQADKTMQDPDGNEFVLGDIFTKEEFEAIRSTDPVKENADGEKDTMNDYTRYVVPARKAYAAQITDSSPKVLIIFVVVLLMVLISMATFRSPAVALMPDVTLKPLRSKGNAIINLMGAAGGILTLVLGKVLATGSAKNAMMSYTGFFGIVVGIMLVSLAIFMWKVPERKWAAEMQRDSIKYGIEEEDTPEETEKRKLSSGELRSLIFVLLSVALWYFGYNAVTSKYAVYASTVLDKDHNATLILAQAAAIVSYIPVGMVASKIGRKKTILAGVFMLTAAFGIASFMRMDSPTWIMNAMFILAGVAWATINVNSFPMVVEMCSGGDVGKFTGYYYTASMAAQSITPTLSGRLMDSYGMTVLFPYAAFFVACAFVTMLMVRHGDTKAAARKGLEAFDMDD